MEQIIENLLEITRSQSRRMDVLSKRIDIANRRVNNLLELVNKQQELIKILSEKDKHDPDHSFGYREIKEKS